MSGRSAHVRKKKTDVNTAGFEFLDHNDSLKEKAPSIKSDPSLRDFPRVADTGPSNFAHHPDFSEVLSEHSGEHGHTHSKDEHNPAYARIRRPQVPVIDVSGIERSSFRKNLDKASENSRNKISNWFQKKKKGGHDDPHDNTPPATPGGAEVNELPAEDVERSFMSAPTATSSHSSLGRGPPHGKLPPLPTPAKILHWSDGARVPQPWDKLGRDPELWSVKGDTLIFFAPEAGDTEAPQPSFRVSSHQIEAMESPIFTRLLHDGLVDEIDGFRSPASSHGPSFRTQPNRPMNPTPPASESSRSFDDPHGQISYNIRLPPAGSTSKTEILRHKLALRNILALFKNAGIVGFDIYSTLVDLHKKLEQVMGSGRGHMVTNLVTDYITYKGLDDVRYNHEAACTLLMWSEHKDVRWEDGWREAFVHCVGMYNQVSSLPKYKNLSLKTRTLLEARSYELSCHVEACEKLLAEFDYSEYWPRASDNSSSPYRAAFGRLQTFFCDYYRGVFDAWPVVPPASRNLDGWLTRDLVKTLATDFNALYDFLVDRSVSWDASVESNKRRWRIVNPSTQDFAPDSYCDFTDYIDNFDNEHGFPHIPHPYPKLPEAVRPAQGKITSIQARKHALSYTEATNIFDLGEDFVCNDMVEAYMEWEKTDKIGEIDPRGARQARWVLIYFILQTLASLSVDTPHLRYKDDVDYFLGPSLAKTPPWNPDNPYVEQAEHYQSHCWTVRATWTQPEPTVREPAPLGLMQGVRPGKLEEFGSPIAGDNESSTPHMSKMSSFESIPRTATFSEADTFNDTETVRTSTAISVGDSETVYSRMHSPDPSIRSRGPRPQNQPVVSLFPIPQGQAQQYQNPPYQPGQSRSSQPHGSQVRSRSGHHQPPRTRSSPYLPPQYPVPSPPGSPDFYNSTKGNEITGLRIQKAQSPKSEDSPVESPSVGPLSNSGYAPGIEKLNELAWPVPRKTVPLSRRGGTVHSQRPPPIRDFDEEI
jgi:hypothetical protein